MKKILALVIAALLLLSMTAAFATGENLTITVENASIGDTYTIYKMLDATVDGNGAIAYQGDVPTELDSVLEKVALGGNPDTIGFQKKSAVSDDDYFAALKAYATNATKIDTKENITSTPVQFTGLDAGYYLITSTMGDKYIVTSTIPSQMTVYEKNENVPQPTKTVDDHTWSIGDTITYTVQFPGANYKGSGADAKIVTTYTVTDTLPPFLTNAHVQSVVVGEGESYEEEITGKDFDATTKSFDIPWATYANGKWTSKYPNGAVVKVVYTAVLSDIVNIGGTKNINTITVTRKTGEDNGDEEPTEEEWHAEEYVYTYGAAIKKVDESGAKLTGAEFQIEGLTAEETATGSGVYTVTKYDPATVTTPTTLVVNDDGFIYIVGLQEGLTLNVTETKAPDGYNKLADPFTVTTEQLGEGTLVKKIDGYRKYDSKGNLIEESVTEISGVSKTDMDLSALTAKTVNVENKKGTQLPSTGGIGTTIFYVGGGLLVLVAVIFLVTKRRMGSND